jgi:amidase
MLPTAAMARSFAASLPAQITDLDATELSLAIRMKLLSSEEVMSAYLAHIHRYKPTYNAIVALRDSDLLLNEARAADKELAAGIYQGWMHGIADRGSGHIFDYPKKAQTPLYIRSNRSMPGTCLRGLQSRAESDAEQSCLGP